MASVDHSTNTVVAFVLGKRTDEAFKELQTFRTVRYKKILYR